MSSAVSRMRYLAEFLLQCAEKISALAPRRHRSATSGVTVRRNKEQSGLRTWRVDSR